MFLPTGESLDVIFIYGNGGHFRAGQVHPGLKDCQLARNQTTKIFTDNTCLKSVRIQALILVFNGLCTRQCEFRILLEKFG